MPAPAKHCLLVIDDEPNMVQSVQDLLRKDYRVLGATRAAEGLKILEREEVHIVMTDQRMPEMTGVELLKCLRDSYPDTTRLLFTGYEDLKVVTDAINEGNVYRFISKPWKEEELRAVLRQAVEHYDLLAERKRLMGEIQEKNRQLEGANRELEQANELKRNFIKVASHELRTPLTIVLGLTELSRRQQDLGPPLKDWLERIYVGSVRLNDRVDQMVKLLLAENFQRTLNRQKVDLAGLLRRSADDVLTFIELRRQILKVELPPDLGHIFVEEDKLRDSVVQLLVNAIKFTPDGGTIRLSACRTVDGAAEIQVADSGVGLDSESRARLFNPFFTRFDVSRHSSGVFEFERRGLGLGLSVVKAFIEAHGGQVKVDSEVNHGTIFTIWLPQLEGAVK